MPKALTILQRILVNYFYKVNAGLFAFAFFVLFGLPYSPLAFHYSLITGIVQSPAFLAVVMLIWLLYNLKCIDYIIKQLKHPEQSFLLCLNALPVRKLYCYNLYVQLLVYLPALLYSAAIVVIAVKKHEYVCATLVILFNAIIVLATPALYMLALQQKKFAVGKSVFPSFRLSIVKPYFLFPLYFLLSERKQMVVVTKAFSLLFLYAFIKLYVPERHDIRPVQLCLLITAASHSTIIYEMRRFEEKYVEFSKNLPLTLTGRFLRMTALYVCLLLPEFILLLRGINTQFSFVEYPQLLLMVIALLCMFYVVLMLEKTNMEQLIKIVFGINAACFFIILYEPGIIFPCAVLVLAFALYNAYYYHYEKR